ncbi:MAG: GtrA family protein [Clostridia bacterium]|nr:GtrA family protein [Clostridia bacterium]
MLFRAETENVFIQFFRYIFVGGFAFLADAAVLWFCEMFMNYMIAAAIAFVVGLTVNYILSVRLVFSGNERIAGKAAEFIIYGIIGAAGLVITEAVMYFFTDICGLYFLLSKIAAAAIVLVWNFAARKKILYSKQGD